MMKNKDGNSNLNNIEIILKEKKENGIKKYKNIMIDKKEKAKIELSLGRNMQIMLLHSVCYYKPVVMLV